MFVVATRSSTLLKMLSTPMLGTKLKNLFTAKVCEVLMAHPINQGEYSLVLDKIYTFVS